MGLFNSIMIVILLTLLPFLELRYSIPAGILKGKINLPFHLKLTGFGINPLLIVPIVIITNILLGFFIYEILFLFTNFFLRYEWFKRLYHFLIRRPQRKIKRYVDRYGMIGIALFIAVPLPGSGVYSGALGSYALGISRRDFYKADIIGVIIAGIIVTIISLFFR